MTDSTQFRLRALLGSSTCRQRHSLQSLDMRALQSTASRGGALKGDVLIVVGDSGR